MIKVRNEITVYEIDGKEQSGLAMPVLAVSSHWNRDSLVVLESDGIRLTVSARDLLVAIANATNLKGRDSLLQQVRELTEENERLKRAGDNPAGRIADLEWDRSQLRSDLSAALASVAAMAERIEQMRPVYERAVEWHRVRVPGMQQHDKFVSTEDALWDAIDTALARTAREKETSKS